MLDLLQTPITLQPAVIRADGGTQSRVSIDDATVTEYREAMQAGAQFPPVVVYYDGSDYWLADGFHRVQAWLAAHGVDDPIPADVRQGDRREAVLHSVGANSSHGLRRTNEDKRRAVVRLLEDDDWKQWSNSEIGRRCNVSESLVRTIRGEAGGDTSHETKYTHPKTGKTTTMKTGGIGKSQPSQRPAPAPQPQRVADVVAQVMGGQGEGKPASGPVDVSDVGQEWTRLQAAHMAISGARIKLEEQLTTFEDYGFGIEAERLLRELYNLREEIKGLRPEDKV